MPARTIALLLLLFAARTAALAQAPSPEQEPTLAARIETLLNDPTVAHAHWGIAISTMEGAPVYGLDEQKFFRPASTAKLFTTAAAMALLGPDHRFHTQIFGDLDPATGSLSGDLTIAGGGDPSFGTADLPYSRTRQANATPPVLQTIADQLYAKGLRHIEGVVLGDSGLFAQEPPPPGWAAEDLLWGYGALPSALSFGDNELALTATAGPTSSNVHIDQLVPYVQVNATPSPSIPDQTPIPFTVRADPTNARMLKVSGNISRNAPPVVEHIALPDPADYVAQALQSALAQRGISASSESATRNSNTQVAPEATPSSYAACPVGEATCNASCTAQDNQRPPLVDVISGPLSAEIAFTLKTSANLHAEVLLHDLAPGAIAHCPGITANDGLKAVRAWLLQAGLPDHEFVFFDGSGLSTKDLVTPRAEAQLLAYAATQPWFPQWKAALPVGGVDGTLANRFTDPALKGRVFAKTGTLGESRALAGYVQCASGRELIFSILVDNHDPTISADRATMDKIVAAIAATN